METVSIRIPKTVFAELSELAKEELRSVPKTIEWLLREYKESTESAQEYCEREPMRSILLQELDDIKHNRNIHSYNSVEEMFDAIKSQG